jgi:hypothetical protein
MSSSLVPKAPDYDHRGGNRPPPKSWWKPFSLGVLLTLIVGIAGFAACALRPTPKAPTNPLINHIGNFDTTANITYRDLKATATITQETPQSCAITFSSPASLQDMSFVFREGVVDLGYKGVSFTFDPQTLPGGALAKIAVAGVNKAMKDDGITVDYTEGVLSLSGLLESGEFTLRLDPENGNLLKLLVPAEDLEIEFVNFTFLD